MNWGTMFSLTKATAQPPQPAPVKRAPSAPFSLHTFTSSSNSGQLVRQIKSLIIYLSNCNFIRAKIGLLHILGKVIWRSSVPMPCNLQMSPLNMLLDILIFAKETFLYVENLKVPDVNIHGDTVKELCTWSSRGTIPVKLLKLGTCQN